MAGPDVLLIGPYPEWDMVELEPRYTLHKLYEAVDRAAALREIGSRVRAIATRGELGASAELMMQLRQLEIVSCYGVGTDAIDLSYARGRSIAVTNTPDVLTEDVADLGVGLLLAVARGIVAGDGHVRSGSWSSRNMGLTTRIYGKRIGIVGLGRIGAAFARRMEAFGCEIGYFGRNAKPGSGYRYFADLTELAAWADALVVTVAGGAGTRDLIGADAFAALGPEGIFVNLSRGTTVNEPALLEALQKRSIKAAGLDVFQNEPNINPAFRTLENVVLQPHHGSATVETRRAMGKLVRDNLAAHFAGSPLLTPVA